MSFRLIEQKTFTEPSAISLIFANLIPLIGAIFLDWNILDIVIFYWLETFVIGIYNIVKMMTCTGGIIKGIENQIIALFSKIFLSTFFLFHFNIFVFIQFFFIIIFLGPDGFQQEGNIKDLIDIKNDGSYTLLIGIIGLFLSHGHSLYLNYYKGKEYQKTDIMSQMFKPYGRIFIQQFVVIFGGMLIMYYESPLPLLVLLVIFKIFSDLIAHWISHRDTIS